MSAKNSLEAERLKRIISMVNERNTNPKKKGFKTENEIVEEYNKKYPNDSSLTQGKLSKIKKGTIEKQDGFYTVLTDEARFRIVENAFKKAKGSVLEVREFAIHCDGSVMDLFRTLERYFYKDIFDVRFDNQKLFFKAFYDPSHFIQDNDGNETEVDYKDIINVLIRIDNKLNKEHEQKD